MTLIELLLAMAGIGLIAGALAAMFSAVAYGTTSNEHMHALISQRQALTRRVNNTIRQSREVVDQGDDALTLWSEDKDNDGKRDNNETKIIKWNGSHNRLELHTGQGDGRTGLGDLLKNLTGNQSFETTIWGEHVTGFSTATSQDGQLVSFRITIKRETLEDIVIGAAALRRAN